MPSFRLLAPLLVLACGVACTSLNYPEPDAEAGGEAPQVWQPARVRPAIAGGSVAPAPTWADMTREAREYRQQGEYDEARERLDQAALQVAGLPATNAQRRTVFGMRARLAEDFAAHGEIEAADDLADQLFEEAEREPEVGGAALVSLALSVAERREAAAREMGKYPSQLELYRLALVTAQTGATSRDRMNLGLRVAQEALAADDLDLARRGIEQAIADAYRVIPTRGATLAALEAERARIAREQGDLDVAESSATTVNLIHAELEASASLRGAGEALLAEILAEKGDIRKARLIVNGAYARIGLGEPIDALVKRKILGARARVERSAGDLGTARRYYDEALAMPGIDVEADREFVRQLQRELRELDDPRVPPPSAPSPTASSAE